MKFISDARAFTAYQIKPQMKTLGPRYGKRLGEIREKLAALDGAAAMAQLNADGVLKLDLGDCVIELAPDDLLIEKAKAEGYASASDNGVKVAVCTILTPELVEEGHVREVVSKIQTMRKDADFNVTDRIRITVSGDEQLLAILERNRAEICASTLAEEISEAEPEGFVKDWNINGMKATFGVKTVG